MAYITNDPRVIDIMKRKNASKITFGEAAGEIKALPPQKDAEGNQISEFGYLPWEIEEALKMTVVGDRPWGG